MVIKKPQFIKPLTLKINGECLFVTVMILNSQNQITAFYISSENKESYTFTVLQSFVSMLQKMA